MKSAGAWVRSAADADLMNRNIPTGTATYGME